MLMLWRGLKLCLGVGFCQNLETGIVANSRLSFINNTLRV